MELEKSNEIFESFSQSEPNRSGFCMFGGFFFLLLFTIQCNNNLKNKNKRQTVCVVCDTIPFPFGLKLAHCKRIRTF